MRYPFEHYPFWRKEFPDMDLPPGTFGENFTTEGLRRRRRFMSAIDFKSDRRSSWFASRACPATSWPRSFSVTIWCSAFCAAAAAAFIFRWSVKARLRPATLFQPVSNNEDGISISEMNRLFFHDKYNRDLLEKAMATGALPKDWRDYFLERLERPAVNT